MPEKVEKERLIIEIDPKLKALFKMALIYEGKNMKDKITELVEEYVNSSIRIEETSETIEGSGVTPLKVTIT